MNDVIFRVNRESLGSKVNIKIWRILKIYSICIYVNVLWIWKQDIEQFRCRTLYFNCYLIYYCCRIEFVLKPMIKQPLFFGSCKNNCRIRHRKRRCKVKLFQFPTVHISVTTHLLYQDQPRTRPFYQLVFQVPTRLTS